MAFSQELWIDILELADPDVVVCLRDVEGHLKPVMERKGLRLVEAILDVLPFRKGCKSAISREVHGAPEHSRVTFEVPPEFLDVSAPCD